MKKIAISQSNYIPWKGYFDLIRSVDEFILYDEMQYTRRDWRNRNKIWTSQGLHWLSIPVEVSGKYFQKISETKVSQKDWAKKHWETLRHAYKKAPCFDEMSPELEPLYEVAGTMDYLSEINELFLKKICSLLDIATTITSSSQYHIVEGKTERLVSICQQAKGNDYLSGPAAKDYIQPELFEQAGIALHFMDYTGYAEYPQLGTPFEHGVSILDLLFMTGHQAKNWLSKKV